MPDISKGASGYSTAFLEDGSPAVAKQPLHLHYTSNNDVTPPRLFQSKLVTLFFLFLL